MQKASTLTIPASLLATRKTWPPTTEIPKVPGIYCFFDTQGQLIYIGRAKVLQQRLRSYLKKPKASTASYSILSCTSWDEAKLLEVQAIQKFQPLLNYEFTFFQRYPFLGFDQGFFFYSQNETFVQEKLFFVGCFRSTSRIKLLFDTIHELLSYKKRPESYKPAPMTRAYKLPQELPMLSFLQGQSLECLEALVAYLLESPKARQESTLIAKKLRLLCRIYHHDLKKKPAHLIWQYEHDQLASQRLY